MHYLRFFRLLKSRANTKDFAKESEELIFVTSLLTIPEASDLLVYITTTIKTTTIVIFDYALTITRITGINKFRKKPNWW